MSPLYPHRERVPLFRAAMLLRNRRTSREHFSCFTLGGTMNPDGCRWNQCLVVLANKLVKIEDRAYYFTDKSKCVN